MTILIPCILAAIGLLVYFTTNKKLAPRENKDDYKERGISYDPDGPPVYKTSEGIIKPVKVNAIAKRKVCKNQKQVRKYKRSNHNQNRFS